MNGSGLDYGLVIVFSTIIPHGDSISALVVPLNNLGTSSPLHQLENLLIRTSQARNRKRLFKRKQAEPFREKAKHTFDVIPSRSHEMVQDFYYARTLASLFRISLDSFDSIWTSMDLVVFVTH